MAAAIKEELGLDATLVEGSGGAFDVEVDGDVVFSKDEAGRFPEADEIIATISD